MARRHHLQPRTPKTTFPNEISRSRPSGRQSANVHCLHGNKKTKTRRTRTPNIHTDKTNKTNNLPGMQPSSTRNNTRRTRHGKTIWINSHRLTHIPNSLLQRQRLSRNERPNDTPSPSTPKTRPPRDTPNVTEHANLYARRRNPPQIQ